MKEDLLILGCGKFAVDIADVAADTGAWNIVALVHDVDTAPYSQFEGYPVLHIEDALSRHHGAYALCALGSSKRQSIIEHAGAGGLRFATLVHPFTRVSATAKLSEGVIVSPGAVIAAASRIGPHTIVNRSASVGHHSQIGAWSFVGPGATICGSCDIESACFIGAGAVVSDHVRIESGAFVCAGAVVTHDVPRDTRVMGVPARAR